MSCSNISSFSRSEYLRNYSFTKAIVFVSFGICYLLFDVSLKKLYDFTPFQTLFLKQHPFRKLNHNRLIYLTKGYTTLFGEGYQAISKTSKKLYSPINPFILSKTVKFLRYGSSIIWHIGLLAQYSYFNITFLCSDIIVENSNSFRFFSFFKLFVKKSS